MWFSIILVRPSPEALNTVALHRNLAGRVIKQTVVFYDSLKSSNCLFIVELFVLAVLLSFCISSRSS